MHPDSMFISCVFACKLDQLILMSLLSEQMSHVASTGGAEPHLSVDQWWSERLYALLMEEYQADRSMSLVGLAHCHRDGEVVRVAVGVDRLAHPAEGDRSGVGSGVDHAWEADDLHGVRDGPDG